MTIEIEPLERARMLWDVLTCGEQELVTKDAFLRIVAGGLTQSALAEREACAKIADERAQWAAEMYDSLYRKAMAEHIANEIRARGKEAVNVR